METWAYDVTVSHPTNFHSGTKRLTFHRDSATGVFLTGADFGCSRPYFNLDGTDDANNIRAWMAEHACTVTNIVKV